MSIKFLKDYSLKDVLNNGHDILQMAHDVFDSVHKIVEKPRPMNIAKESMKIAQVLLTREMPNSQDYFWNEWDTVMPSEMSFVVLDLLKSYRYRVVKTADKTSSVRVSNVDGVDFGWVSQEGKAGAEDVWCREGTLVEARAKVCELLWKKYGDKPLLVRKEKDTKDYTNKIALEVDDKIPPLRSQKAGDMSRYLKRCFDAGVSRSQLYYGPPGTGKSTLVRAVAHELGLRTVRVRVEDIGDMDNSLIHEIITIFKPDAIIFDDIDRAPIIHHMLEMMDDLKRNIKLLAATANNKNELGDAMLRPGRFDELIEFRYLEREIIERELGPDNVHLYDKVCKWPIVYIQELVTRRRFMDEAEAIASLTELQKRVDALKKYGGDEDDDDEPSTLLNEDGSIDIDLVTDPDDIPGPQPAKPDMKAFGF